MSGRVAVGTFGVSCGEGKGDGESYNANARVNSASASASRLAYPGAGSDGGVLGREESGVVRAEYGEM